MTVNQNTKEFWKEKRKLSIAAAGNTGPKCLFVLRDKGYELSHYHVESEINGKTEYSETFDAKKDGRFFSAGSPEELLGLVAMWESRGDEWQKDSEEEWQFYEQFMDEARVYDTDEKDIT